MPELSEQSVKSLRIRQQLGREIIRKLRTEWSDEDGAAEAKATYEEQLGRITEELRKRRKERREARGEEKPPEQVMEMKPATLGAQTPKRGNGSLAEKLREELEKQGLQVEVRDAPQEE